MKQPFSILFLLIYLSALYMPYISLINYAFNYDNEDEIEINKNGTNTYNHTRT